MTGRNAIPPLLAAVLLLAGCGHKKHVRVTPAARPSRTAIPVKVGYTEDGLASWYGIPYHGRPAANGEIYDMDKMTAAHRTLPFDTWVRVYDLDNQKTTEVRITDRGPFIDGRIIDLSRAAAREIAMIGPGTARIRLEVIRVPEAAPAGVYAVQVGAFRDKENAERLREEMEKNFGVARILPRSGNTPTWRVLVGAEPSQDEASTLASRIRQKLPNIIAYFVVRIDTI